MVIASGSPTDKQNTVSNALLTYHLLKNCSDTNFYTPIPPVRPILPNLKRHLPQRAPFPNHPIESLQRRDPSLLLQLRRQHDFVGHQLELHGDQGLLEGREVEALRQERVFENLALEEGD